MKGQPFELACRGGSLLIQESRATRRGTVAWALWRSQISSVGCVFETANDDQPTIYLHLRDGRRFAVEEVAPQDCFRLFELLGYEPAPDPSAAETRTATPVVIDLGDRHTRVVTGAQDVQLEQDGRALYMLPCDHLLGVRVAARAETTKVEIVGRDGVGTQLDGVPFAAALRLMTLLGVAPDEAAPLAPPVPIAVPTPDPVTAEPPHTAAEAETAMAAAGASPSLAPPPASAASGKPAKVARMRAGGTARAARARMLRKGSAASPRAAAGTAASLRAAPDMAAAPEAFDTPVAPDRPITATPPDVASPPLPVSPVSGSAYPPAFQRSSHAPPSARGALPPALQRDTGDAPTSAVASTSAAGEPVTVRGAVSLLWGAMLASVALRLARVYSALAAALRRGAALRSPLGARRRVASRVPARDSGQLRSPQAWNAALRTWGMTLMQAERAGLHEFAMRAHGVAGAARHALPSPRLHRRPSGEGMPFPLVAAHALRGGRDRAYRLAAHTYANLQALPGSMVAHWRHVALVAALAAVALPAAGDALVAPVSVATHGGPPAAVQPANPRPSRAAVPSASAQSVVYAGSLDGAIYALDAHAGTLLWTYDTGSPVEGGPVVVGGVIYAGEADGSIVALEAAAQRELWRYHTGDIVRAAPAVVDGVVYAGSSDHHLYALRADDGMLLWRFTAGDWFAGTPLVAGGMVYAGSFDGTLYALDARTGRQVWHLTTPGAVAVAQTIVNDTIYASSSDDTLYAMDATTGAIRWRFTTGGSLYAAPVVANGVVYVGSCDTDLYALRADDGAEVWQAPAGGLVLEPAVVAGQTVYVTSAAGTLYALRVSDGAPRWHYTTRGATAGPTVADDAVYTSAGDSSIFALDVQDGVPRWSYHTGGRVTSSAIGVSGS